jgi:hypothetical protein
MYTAWGHALKSSGLLRYEATWARVSQFGLKTVEVWRWMMYTASSQRSCRSEGKDDRFDGVEHGVAKVGPN